MSLLITFHEYSTDFFKQKLRLYFYVTFFSLSKYVSHQILLFPPPRHDTDMAELTSHFLTAKSVNTSAFI